jgi:hypothetical protein
MQIYTPAIGRRNVKTLARKDRHSPRLDTQLMIEKCIREKGPFTSRRALMRALPRKVEYPTLVTVLDYLEASEKILIKGDSITWVFTDNPKLLKLLRESIVMDHDRHNQLLGRRRRR